MTIPLPSAGSFIEKAMITNHKQAKSLSLSCHITQFRLVRFPTNLQPVIPEKKTKDLKKPGDK